MPSNPQKFHICNAVLESNELQQLLFYQLSESFGPDPESLGVANSNAFWKDYSDGQYIKKLVINVGLALKNQAGDTIKEEIFNELLFIANSNFHKKHVTGEFIALFYVDENNKPIELLPELKPSETSIEELLKHYPTTDRLLKALMQLSLKSNNAKTQLYAKELILMAAKYNSYIEKLYNRLIPKFNEKHQNIILGISKGNQFILAKLYNNSVHFTEVLQTMSVGDENIKIRALDALANYCHIEPSFKDALSLILEKSVSDSEIGARTMIEMILDKTSMNNTVKNTLE
jgi:hypothetical protein